MQVPSPSASENPHTALVLAMNELQSHADRIDAVLRATQALIDSVDGDDSNAGIAAVALATATAAFDDVSHLLELARTNVQTLKTSLSEIVVLSLSGALQ